MKIRSDFVSNSSSSSFIVKAGKGVPSIFKVNRLTFKQYCSRFFRRDITENFEYFFENWNGGFGAQVRDVVVGMEDIRQHVTYMTPKQFVSRYSEFKDASNFSRLLPVLKSDKKLVERMYRLSLKINELDMPRIEIFKNGGHDRNLTSAALNSVRRIQDRYRDRINGIIGKIADHFRKALGDSISGWRFWYAELYDDDEIAGENALREDSVKWARVFNNH